MNRHRTDTHTDTDTDIDTDTGTDIDTDTDTDTCVLDNVYSTPSSAAAVAPANDPTCTAL